jgi:hypothetical protein
MCADADKYDLIALLFEKCAIIASDIDASAARICLLDRMISKKRMELVDKEKILPLEELNPHFLRSFLKILEK